MYTTKSGKEITFEWYPFDEKNDNRGFIQHRLEAFVDRQNVGYMKIGYIPSGRLKKVYNHGILSWLGKSRGKLLGFDRRGMDDRLVSMSKEVDQWKDWLSPSDVKQMPRSKKRDMFDYYADQIRDKYASIYEDYKNFHVDKPQVDFIEVVRKRQRIGYSLYKKGAKLMAKRRMVLYSSTVQSEDAKKVWEFLRRKSDLPIKKEVVSYFGNSTKRYYIDYR